MNEFLCKTYEETVSLGEEVSKTLRGREIFGLCGELGSGKTAFVKGVAKGLGYNGYVKSPTFTIINQYNAERLKLIHLDIYRLSSFEELLLTGFESYIKDDTVIIIEWFDKFPELSGIPHIRVDFEYIDETTRRIRFRENIAVLTNKP